MTQLIGSYLLMLLFNVSFRPGKIQRLIWLPVWFQSFRKTKKNDSSGNLIRGHQSWAE